MGLLCVIATIAIVTNKVQVHVTNNFIQQEDQEIRLHQQEAGLVIIHPVCIITSFFKLMMMKFH